MHSLTQEIRSFSRANLRKQRTRVTTLTGRRVIETWRGACLQVEEAEAAPGGSGYVQDLSADLQVGVVKPWLLLGEWGRGAAGGGRRQAPVPAVPARLLPPGQGAAGGSVLPERLRFIPPSKRSLGAAGPGASREGRAAGAVLPAGEGLGVATGSLSPQGRRMLLTTWRR